MKTFRFLLQMALGIALPLAIQLWHRRRLAPAQRAVAWNSATWAAALYAFGPLSLVGWFVVTRGVLPFGRVGRVLAGLGLGAAVAACTFLVIFGVDWVVALAFGLPP